MSAIDFDGMTKEELVGYVRFMLWQHRLVDAFWYLFTEKEHGSEAALKAVGKLRVEGKEYIVQEGDVCQVLFN